MNNDDGRFRDFFSIYKKIQKIQIFIRKFQWICQSVRLSNDSHTDFALLGAKWLYPFHWTDILNHPRQVEWSSDVPQIHRTTHKLRPKLSNKRVNGVRITPHICCMHWCTCMMCWMCCMYVAVCLLEWHMINIISVHAQQAVSSQHAICCWCSAWRLHEHWDWDVQYCTVGMLYIGTCPVPEIWSAFEGGAKWRPNDRVVNPPAQCREWNFTGGAKRPTSAETYGSA